MTTHKEALTLALEALCTCGPQQKQAITAIKEALAQPEQELLAWKNAALRVGEDLSSVGPKGYYNMTAQQWLDWAMAQQPRGNNSLAQPEQEPCKTCNGTGEVETGIGMMVCDECHGTTYTTPPQRKQLTDAMMSAAARVLNDRQAEACGVDKDDQWKVYGEDFIEDARAMLTAAHGIKVDA